MSYLEHVNKECYNQGFIDPTVIPTQNNKYLFNDHAMNYHLAYAKTLDNIVYKDTEIPWYIWFGSGVLLGMAIK